MLCDTGSTCNLLTEEQVIVLLNHCVNRLKSKEIDKECYNYPILQIFKYEEPANLRGAELNGRMAVEFAILCRVEFIPAGNEQGPCRDIYFKVLKSGSCAIMGGVLGWPTLDAPSLGGEGMGWMPESDGFTFRDPAVTIPRMDDHRKNSYRTQVDRYTASETLWQLMKIQGSG